MITVLTACFNSSSVIGGLIESLENQTFKEFKWVVIDGGSTDNTLEIINSVPSLDTQIISEADFGIYDALNKGLSLISTEYYLVIGSDDKLEANCLSHFDHCMKAHPGYDFYAASFQSGDQCFTPCIGAVWRNGIMGAASSHSVGLLIRRSLHEKVGRYSNLYPIAADQFFVLDAIKKGARVKSCDFVAGEFALGGTSSKQAYALTTDLFRVNLNVGGSFVVQFLLLLFRIMKIYVSSLVSEK